MKQKKWILFTLTGLLTSLSFGMTSFAATWRTGAGANQDRWWYDYEDGSYANNGWHWIDGNQDGVAECYYFDSDGWMAANGTTPDGYEVNKNGAWVSGGSVMTQSITGGTSVSSQGVGADVTAQMNAKLQRAVEIWDMWSFYDGEGSNDCWNLIQDNVEHWTDYAFINEPVPTFQDGSSGYENTNTMYAAICNSYDQYINQYVELPMDYVGWLSTFENEAAVLNAWCGGRTDNLKDVKDMYMLGVVRYAATLANGRGYSLGNPTTSVGTYTWNGKTSAYTVPILLLGADGLMNESGLVAIFDANMNLMNIIYTGAGADTDIMRYAYGEPDYEQRGGKLTSSGAVTLYY